MKENKLFWKSLPVLFGFFIMGFCDLVGISVTYAKDHFGWSETQAGFLPSMVFIWFLLLSVPTAMAMNKWGQKNTVMVGMGLTILGLILPVVMFEEWTCYLMFALLGIGNTVLQVSLNPLLTQVVQKDKLTSSVTAGQFIKAVSSFVGPLVAGYCSVRLGAWQWMFPVFAGVTVLSSLWLVSTSIHETNQTKNVAGFGETIRLLGNSKIAWLFVGILCIVGLDVGMNTVTPKLMIERLGMAKEAAGYGTSWYFAARTAGTFLGAILLVKFPAVRYFRLNIIITCAALVTLFFAGSTYLLLGGICLIAFTSSSVFPIIYAQAIQEMPEKMNQLSGLMITGVAGGAIVPPLMGFAADSMGNQNGSLIIISVCAAYLMVCAFLIREKR